MSALLLIDIQEDFYSNSPSIKNTFPHLEERVGRILKSARKNNFPVIHVRQIDTWENSPW